MSSRSPVSPRGSTVTCHLASCEEELEAHFWLRRTVFVEEQRLFAVEDRDERDLESGTLHVLGLADGEPSGAVRLYPLDGAGAQWKGDRLAVLPEHRTNHLGAQLVRFAVGTAGWLGGRQMIAHVQLANVRFFERLGWRVESAPVPFHGTPHQLMSIGLRSRVPGA